MMVECGNGFVGWRRCGGEGMDTYTFSSSEMKKDKEFSLESLLHLSYYSATDKDKS